MRCTRGRIYDVIIDLRPDSPTYCQWIGVELASSPTTRGSHLAPGYRTLYIPEGFAHGFLVLSEYAEFLYKTTDYYAPEHERTIVWNDPVLAIAWPLSGEPVLAAKDAGGFSLQDAEVFA